MKGTEPRQEGMVRSILRPPRGPIRPKYELFRMVGEPGWPLDYEEVWAVGDVGTGKTSAMIDSVLVSAINYPGSRLLVLRSTYEELKSATIPDIQNRLAPLFENRFLEYIRDLGLIRVANGSEIHFFGLDTADNKLWGQQWFRAFIDQGERIKTQDMLDLLHTRIRLQVRHKDSGEMGKTFIKITANWDKGRNWVWKRIIKDSEALDEKGDIRTKTISAKVKGKVVSSHILTIQSYTVENEELTEDYFKHLVLSGRMGTKAMRGGWEGDKEEGVVFIEMGRKNLVDKLPPLAGKMVICGLDHGLYHPTVMIALVIDGGKAYAISEYIRRNASVIANAQAIAELLYSMHKQGAAEIRVYADPAMWQRSAIDALQRSTADFYQEVLQELPFPVFFSPASGRRRMQIESGANTAQPSRSIDYGLGVIKSFLSRGQLLLNQDQTPGLLETLDSLTYEHIQKDTMPYIDIADALRYAIINIGNTEDEDGEEDITQPQPYTLRRNYA